jgi:hypothetical protein
MARFDFCLILSYNVKHFRITEEAIELAHDFHCKFFGPGPTSDPSLVDGISVIAKVGSAESVSCLPWRSNMYSRLQYKNDVLVAFRFWSNFGQTSR